MTGLRGLLRFCVVTKVFTSKLYVLHSAYIFGFGPIQNSVYSVLNALAMALVLRVGALVNHGNFKLILQFISVQHTDIRSDLITQLLSHQLQISILFLDLCGLLESEQRTV